MCAVGPGVQKRVPLVYERSPSAFPYETQLPARLTGPQREQGDQALWSRAAEVCGMDSIPRPRLSEVGPHTQMSLVSDL